MIYPSRREKPLKRLLKSCGIVLMSSVAASAWAVPTTLAAAQLRQLSAAPTGDFTVGRSLPLELHAIRNAAFSQLGGLVIADSGNDRVIVLNHLGEVTATFGSKGAGPSEFRYLASVHWASDTIITYDPMLNRVSWWDMSGEFISSFPIPQLRGRPASLMAVLSPRSLLVSSRSPKRFDRSTMYVMEGSLGLWYPDTNMPPQELFQGGFSTSMFWRDGNGSSTYPLPHFGELQVAAWSEKLVHSQLGEPVLRIHEDDGEWSEVRLPLRSEAFDRSGLESALDSLRQRSRSSPSVRSRLSEMASALDLPEHQPYVGRLIDGGSFLWVEVGVNLPGKPTRWLLLNRLYQVAAEIALPAGWHLLAATTDRIAVLHTDDLGVQTVTVHALSES